MQTVLSRRGTTRPVAAQSQFSGQRLRTVHPTRKFFTASRPHQRRAASLLVRAKVEWPDKELLEHVKENFPDAGVADVEEARTLFSDLGYTYLDVRPTLELEEVGKVRGSVNLPIVTATRKYDAKEGKKVVHKEDNPDFIAQVEKRFPDKENAKLLIACSNGRKYSMDALMALDEAGYSNIVGLKGGYAAWNRAFDNKLARRRWGEYQENYSHDGDSCGIHGSGASFDRVDAIEHWTPPDF